MEHRLIIEIETETIEFAEKEFLREKFGWSKWGGGNQGFLNINEWSCQACGKQQTHELPWYFIPLFEAGPHENTEYVRICASCKHIELEHRLGYRQLCDHVRPKGI